MATEEKNYKGVVLSGDRTKKTVDFIIANYDKMNVNSLAEKLGYKSYHKVVPMIRVLIRKQIIKQKGKSFSERYKGVILSDGLTKSGIEYIIDNYKTQTPTEIAQHLEIGSVQKINWALINLKKGSHIETVNVVVKEEEKKKIHLNTFDNYDGDGKHEARELITRSICRTSTVKSNILTLPADQWLMEKKILGKKMSFKFTAVERHTPTYQAMIKNMVNNRKLLNAVISTHNSKIGDVIKLAESDMFSSAILDYCGVIDTVYLEIKELLERNLVRRDGYITLTIAQSNRTINNSNHANNFSNSYAEICGLDTKGNTMPINNFLVHNLLFNLEGRYKLDDTFMYRDKIHGYGMALYIIRRMK